MSYNKMDEEGIVKIADDHYSSSRINEDKVTKNNSSSNGHSIIWVTMGLLIILSFINLGILINVRHTEMSINTAMDKMNSYQPLPYKYAVDYVTPLHTQDERGTCWAFGTINFLESSYRAQGIKNQWMKPDEYLALSQQAYGISVVHACVEHPDICEVYGDEVYPFNNTEGGEMEWLYYLTSLYTQVLPNAVCPYISDQGQDLVCPGMEEALLKNPLKFNINDFKIAYNVPDVKNLLYETGISNSWGSGIPQVEYFYPADNEDFWNAYPKVPCPQSFNDVWCVKLIAPSYNMEGEFYLNKGLVNEGGHAMNVVGWNDHFVTQDKTQGGFIIKNSWHDLVYPEPRGPRGSHSIAFFMQEISPWEERIKCPNPYNPKNWLSCVNTITGPRLNSGVTVTEEPKLDNCLDDDWMLHTMKHERQALEFSCTDTNICSTDPGVRYFLLNITMSPSLEFSRCYMLEYPSLNTIVTPFLNPSVIALIFQPIQSHLDELIDDPDVCGFYFFPYDVVSIQNAHTREFWTTYFNITWADQSYLHNKNNYRHLDYTLLEESTKIQRRHPKFIGPNPNGKRYGPYA